MSLHVRTLTDPLFIFHDLWINRLNGDGRHSHHQYIRYLSSGFISKFVLCLFLFLWFFLFCSFKFIRIKYLMMHSSIYPQTVFVAIEVWSWLPHRFCILRRMINLWPKRQNWTVHIVCSMSYSTYSANKFVFVQFNINFIKIYQLTQDFQFNQSCGFPMVMDKPMHFIRPLKEIKSFNIEHRT